MLSTSTTYRTYDPRLRILGHLGAPDSFFDRLDVPRTTLQTWRHIPPPVIVSHKILNQHADELRVRIL